MLSRRKARSTARLTAASMDTDLTFKRAEHSYQAWVSNIYVEYTCKENVAAMTWLLVMGVGLGLLRRIRRA